MKDKTIQIKFPVFRIGCILLLGIALAAAAAPASGQPGRTADADTTITRLQATLPAGHFLESARAARDRGQWEIAELEYQQVLVREPAHLDAIMELAAVYERMGKYEHARGLLSRAASLDPGNQTISDHAQEVGRKLAESLHAEIDTLIRNGGYAPALPRLSLLMTLEPEQPDLLYQQALCHYHLSRNDIALSSIEKALLMRQEESYHDLYRLILARIKQQQLHTLMRNAAHIINPKNEADRQSALTLLARVIELDPDNRWAKQEFLRLSDRPDRPRKTVSADAPWRYTLGAEAREAGSTLLMAVVRELPKYTMILLSLLAVLLIFQSPLTRALLQGLPQRSLLYGQLDRFSITEILTLIHSHDYTGTLYIKGGVVSGKIFFEHGEAYHCTAGRLNGREALRAIMKRAVKGRFYFKQTKPPVERTIEVPLSLLIMDLPARNSSHAQSAPKREKSKITQLLENR